LDIVGDPKGGSVQVATPTDAEYDILRVLWERGACTVREIHSVIAKTRPIGYTTVLKQMQVMQGKGILRRSERFRSHLYEPVQSQAQTQRQFATAMLRQVFDGSARGLLQSALAGRKVDARELQEIREVLEHYERRLK
jgi:BlaI family penicillinase repressor